MQMGALITASETSAGTRDRVRLHSSAKVNQRIDQKTMKRIWFYATQPREEITRRIRELDQEWDVERMMATKTAAVGLGGMALGFTVNRRWLIVPALALGCLMQHALFRSSPAVQLMRRMGARTRREIESEKYALRMLRGDFDALKDISEETHRAIEALRLSRL